MNIRPALADDCKYIADIYNHYLGISTMDLEKKDASYYQAFLSHKDEREELWVSIKKEQIIAWGIIKLYSDRKGYRRTCETSVYCHPDHLGQGIGTTLKKHLMSRCEALDFRHLIAKINSDNKVSIHYNLRLGYTVVGEQNQIGYIDGKWKNVTIMQCLIGAAD